MTDKENDFYIPASLSRSILKKLCFRGNTAEKEDEYVGIVETYYSYLKFVNKILYQILCSEAVSMNYLNFVTPAHVWVLGATKALFY